MRLIAFLSEAKSTFLPVDAVNWVQTQKVKLNFSDVLIFDERVGIAQESISCNLHGGFATALSASVDSSKLGIVVTLAAAVPVTPTMYVTVTCTVDQSVRACAAH